jgi:hypothetical protein
MDTVVSLWVKNHGSGKFKQESTNYLNNSQSSNRNKKGRVKGREGNIESDIFAKVILDLVNRRF